MKKLIASLFFAAAITTACNTSDKSSKAPTKKMVKEEIIFSVEQLKPVLYSVVPKVGICTGRKTYLSKTDCKKQVMGGLCFKSRFGWCKSTCGNPDALVMTFRKLHGACFIANHCAYLVSHALRVTGCPDFRGRSNARKLALKLEEWGFTKHTFDPKNPKPSLAKVQKGAILYFKGHVAIYAGDGKIIDAVPGWYSQCGLKSNSSRYKDLIGKQLLCAEKNPWQNRRPTVAGNEKTRTRTGIQYSKLTSHVQCVAEHSLMSGRTYKGYPLLAFYQRR